MAIIYSKHAKEMLSHRDINKEFADKCAADPDKILTANNNKKIYLKDFGTNFLKLIIAEEGEDKIIITVHWVAKKRVG